jgi:hypothetical protein
MQELWNLFYKQQARTEVTKPVCLVSEMDTGTPNLSDLKQRKRIIERHTSTNVLSVVGESPQGQDH